LSSLAGPYGIGSLGRCAYRFVDFLSESHQRYWQLLPLVPVDEYHSPYRSASCFAGGILYIDLEVLTKEGLLATLELPPQGQCSSTDYEAAAKIKMPLLKLAVERFDENERRYRRFLAKNRHWLEDYALFESISAEYGGLADFPEELKFRQPKALEAFALTHREEIRFHKVTQFLFYEQFFALKRYAAAEGVELIGDIPFYVAPHGADVWCTPDAFRLDRDLTPLCVAGMPPDRFSESGQLWGNPIYDWDYQRKTRYEWWQTRLRHCASMYDAVRIDHFRAFANFYSVRYGAEDARLGAWENGPGYAFWQIVRRSLGNTVIIAEDLGGEEAAVKELLAQTGFPNMKVLQFAFETDWQNEFLPVNYTENCVCYTGTHDNDTIMGWYENAPLRQRKFFERLAPLSGESAALRMIAMAMRSRAHWVIIPLQDWLEADGTARMNRPGTREENWEWRVPAGALNDDLCETVRTITRDRNTDFGEHYAERYS
ncbi:MAG: 4-alpha-glucanotransferase, partial [Clostridia bacterium]|nr:4-alpha-glucanotransferase [Clostridia bacterium]